VNEKALVNWRAIAPPLPLFIYEDLNEISGITLFFRNLVWLGSYDK
jgi:hypothetical protein